MTMPTYAQVLRDEYNANLEKISDAEADFEKYNKEYLNSGKATGLTKGKQYNGKFAIYKMEEINKFITKTKARNRMIDACINDMCYEY